MIVLYKCRCMTKERSLVVTDRVPGSDISVWMGRVVEPALQYDHAHRQLLCRATALEYVKIPLEEGVEIGTQPTRN